LQVLAEELKKYSVAEEPPRKQTGPTRDDRANSGATSKTSQPDQRQNQTKPAFKPLADSTYARQVSFGSFVMDYTKMSDIELQHLVKKRKLNYHNMVLYLSKEVVPKLDTAVFLEKMFNSLGPRQFKINNCEKVYSQNPRSHRFN
jgi:hypothetical protein